MQASGKFAYTFKSGRDPWGGTYTGLSHRSSRDDEDQPISAIEPHLLERILKAPNDIKSEVGIIKKHACIPETPKLNGTTAPRKITPRSTDPASAKRTNFAGVAREATTFVPRSLVNRPMTTMDNDDEDEQTAFMSMIVAQQPIAKNNLRIMTSQNNVSVLGDY